jgi:hypothetical protein
MIFAIMNMAPQVAAVLTREVEFKTLDRIRMSPVRVVEFLGGVALAEVALSALSVALMLATARFMGFHNQGSYLAAFALSLTAALAVVGIGMVIAAFAKTQQQAAPLGVLVAVPGSFLSGAFFPVPTIPLVAGIGVADLLPTTHAVVAMRKVMTFGNGIDAVGASLVALVALARRSAWPTSRARRERRSCTAASRPDSLRRWAWARPSARASSCSRASSPPRPRAPRSPSRSSSPRSWPRSPRSATPSSPR